MSIFDIEVREDSGGRYVEFEGVEYTSEDMPEVGTYIHRVDAYTGIDEQKYADLTWSADTPSGLGGCTAKER